MKHLKVILTLILSCVMLNILSQSIVANNGCLKMYGDAGITNNGAWYYSYIQNTCPDYYLIESSKYKVKFKGFDDEGKTKFRTKSIKFPDVFLAPGTYVTKDKSRSDNSSVTYSKVMWQSGEMGAAYKGFTGTPVEGAIKLNKNTKTFIGVKDGVEFYLILTTAADNWEGNDFTKYKVKLLAVNTTSMKVSPDAFVNYNVYFHGQPYYGDLQIKKMKPNDVKTRQEKERCLFNFEPEVYINITNTNINTTEIGTTEGVDGGTAAPAATTTVPNSYQTPSASDNASASSAEDSKNTPSMESSNNTSHIFSLAGLNIVNDGEVGENTLEDHILKGAEAINVGDYTGALVYLKKAKSLDTQKGPAYYQAEYLYAYAKNKKGDELYEQNQFEQAEAYYKSAVSHLKNAKMITAFKDGVGQETYDENMVIYSENSRKWAEKKETLAKEQEANEKLYNELINEGKSAVETKDYASAMEKFELAAQLNVNNGYAEGKYNSAKEKYELEIAKAQKEAELKQKLAAEKLAQEQAEAEQKSNFEASIKKGDEFLKIEQVEEAIEAYQEALLLDYDNAIAVEKINYAKDFKNLKEAYVKRFNEVTYHDKNYKSVTIENNEWFVDLLSTNKDQEGNFIEFVKKPKEFNNSTLIGKAKSIKFKELIPSKDSTDSENVEEELIPMYMLSGGYIYNQQAVRFGNLCPKGWHVSTIDEWRNLIISLGGVQIKDEKLSEKVVITYQIENNYVLSYDESVVKSLTFNMSGFGVTKSNYSINAELHYATSEVIYWAADNEKNFAVSIQLAENSSNDQLLVRIINYNDDVEMGGYAFPCKCVKN